RSDLDACDQGPQVHKKFPNAAALHTARNSNDNPTVRPFVGLQMERVERIFGPWFGGNRVLCALRLPGPMSAAEAHAKRYGADERDALSPSPDLSYHDFYTPSRKSSRGGYVPNVVIPSTDFYGSATPSPLSPVTPPDRLSPIEELDDNASLRSTKVPGPTPFETGAHHGSNQPRARPRSNEFDLHASDNSDGNEIVSIETRSELLFSRRHLELIFADKDLSTRFGDFLRTYRPESVPVLGYYLETIKALKTLRYAEAVVKGLERIPGLEFTADSKGVTMTWVLEDKADRALDILTQNDLPAFIAYIYVSIIDLALVERVTGREDSESKDVAIGLAEVFTISDPSRSDNPLVFASEEFHRMTQYPSNIALGRNCRFLGGPKTDPNAISRFKTSLEGEREHCEVMINYRRDGTPFVNFIMVVPLKDQNGKVRYYLGAQLDITELVNGSVGLNSLQKLVIRQQEDSHQHGEESLETHNDLLTQFEQLSETFTPQELQTVLRSQQRQEMDDQVVNGFDNLKGSQSHNVRVRNSSADRDSKIHLPGSECAPSLGFYKNDLRIPGILQSPLMDQIGGSSRVRDDLYHALEAGQKVTAKVQWLPQSSDNGVGRWIHCTPLISASGLIGVWMVILVDDDHEVLQATQEQPQSDSLPTTMEMSDDPEPPLWGSAKPERARQNGSSGTPSTTGSSRTAVSDSGKPTFEKVPSIVKEVPETMPLPFTSQKVRGPNAGVPCNEQKPLPSPPPISFVGHDDLPRSPDSLSRSRQQEQQQHQHGRQHYGQPPDLPTPAPQSFPIRPGPRIAGKAYSFDSEHGLSSEDGYRPISSRGGDRPTSRDSHVTVNKSHIPPADIRWRRPDETRRAAPNRGGYAPIKIPGKSSQDSNGSQRAFGWKTKKSLSPYGFLFND
ncbi:MAG: hypothetical protein Q9226_008036, partial [Calogaya cf. arnoldii]